MLGTIPTVTHRVIIVDIYYVDAYGMIQRGKEWLYQPVLCRTALVTTGCLPPRPEQAPSTYG